MNHQSHLTLPEIATAHNLSSLDVNARLIDLLGQHSAVVNRLRSLQVEIIAEEGNFKNENWNALENEVARLRFEIENLKKSFTPARVFADQIFFDEF